MNLWRDIFDSLNDGVIVLSTALEPLAVNPAAETLVGVSQANPALMGGLMGRNPWLHKMLLACLESEQDLSQAEATLALGGRTVSVRAEVSPLLGQQGHLAGAIIVLHDLSHEKGARRTVEHEDDEAHLGLSPAGLAHEIKNPLTGIKGAAELLAGLFPSDYRAQQYCAVIREGADRLAALVEQVLAVSAPYRLKLEPVNIHKILHQALALAGLYPVAPAGFAIEQQFDPSLPEVRGDAVALERVFLNLIKNAVEAIDSRGVIRLRTRMETEFHLASGGTRRRFLRVEVSDSGKGLTDPQLGRLFTPFYTTKPNGTGLGLVLSQRIVALHGGKLWAERSGRDQLAADRPALEGTAEEEPEEEAESAVATRRMARPTRPHPAGDSDPLPGATFKVTLPVANERAPKGEQG